jgi:hypothetical protein
MCYFFQKYFHYIYRMCFLLNMVKSVSCFLLYLMGEKGCDKKKMQCKFWEYLMQNAIYPLSLLLRKAANLVLHQQVLIIYSMKIDHWGSE